MKVTYRACVARRRDTEIGGVAIARGSIVITRYGAANRDPAQFGCPNRFDPDRENVRSHVAFGHGAHFCIGAALARQEIGTGLLEFVRRADDIALASGQPSHLPSFANYVLKELPLTYRPAPGQDRDHAF